MCALIGGLTAASPGQTSATPLEPPKGISLTWGKEPNEELSSKRAQICLNGLWRFVPAEGDNITQPKTDWGWITVPGSWARSGWPAVPYTMIQRGKTPIWGDDRGRDIFRGWYERPISIPAEWKGRAILLDFGRVGTDAEVFINGKKVGEVEWPMGQVDITSAVTPGQEAQLRVRVVATTKVAEVKQFMETAERQVTTVKAEVRGRGLTGDVLLISRPKGSFVSDVFVQPSVRNGELKLDVELTGATGGPVTLTARLLDQNGKVEKQFGRQVTASKSDVQTLSASWKWPNPRLWDLGQPNLYTLKLQVRGAGIDDEYTQEFGFREFWIDGKQFLLNGVQFRMRPSLGGVDMATREQIEEAIDRDRGDGFNFHELWPLGVNRRGEVDYQDLFAGIADREGWCISGVMPHMGDFISGSTLKTDEYEQSLQYIKRLRNHPSIIMWGTSANYFGHVDDQNPYNVGRRSWAEDNEFFRKRRLAGEAGLAIIKKYDSTRPAFTHQGAYVGDVFAVNNYLCMIPLQEREEWLSYYRDHGDMPFMSVEFGTPMDLSLHRGHEGHHIADSSEPLMSEWLAAYFGADAYAGEPEDYRQQMRSTYKGGQEWQFRGVSMGMRPYFQKLQVLFSTNTWRSWRTLGTTGGMLPWHEGYMYDNSGRQTRKFPPFDPGRRGVWFPERSEVVKKLMPAGEALRIANGYALAWIAGPAEDPLIKDHHFTAGQTVQKQAVIINDERSEQPYEVNWTAFVGKQQVGQGRASAKVASAENAYVPIRFALPPVAQTTDGFITMEAKIGKHALSDRFEFRVYPTDAVGKPAALLAFDPEGQTTKFLTSLGYQVQPWNGQPAEGKVLIIGRRALEGGKPLPGNVEKFVAGGGRAIVFGQSHEYLRETAKLRVAWYAARRLFVVPSQKDHPLVAGLDPEDFRDWNGAGTLVEARPKSYEEKAPSGNPYAGWKWGNHGTVSSAMIEKPHHGGWTPILEGEFDLAYSPLMELKHGTGRLIWCTLDLEERAMEPMAAIMGRRLVDYAASTNAAPPAQAVTYIGNASGENLLKQLSVRFTTSSSVPNQPGVLVVGPGAQVADEAIRSHISAGGRVLVLARTDGKVPLGFNTAKAQNFIGSLKVPAWEECRGLSASDLRLRCDLPVHVLSGGGQIGADGLLGRVQNGQGVAIIFQMSPDLLPTAKETFFRYSAWRSTRAISQILANLGAQFQVDSRSFQWSAEEKPLPLAGSWQSSVELAMTNAPGADKPNVDPGNKGEDAGMAAGTDQAQWNPVFVPGAWEKAMKGFDGVVWVRRQVTIPADWAGNDLTLTLGSVDDYDVTYFNGQQIGATGADNADAWQTNRKYTIPGQLVKAGPAVIAIRVFDNFGDGGFTGSEAQMKLALKNKPQESMPLHGNWKYQVEARVATATSQETRADDPGNRGVLLGWNKPDLADADWKMIKLPTIFEQAIADMGGDAGKTDGAVWFRRTFTLPAVAGDMILRLGQVGDEDTTYINGVKVGQTAGPGARQTFRQYIIPARLLKTGENLIAVRVFNAFGDGGLVGQPGDLTIGPAGPAGLAEFYSPDFRTDFTYGDDPYRYYRW